MSVKINTLTTRLGSIVIVSYLTSLEVYNFQSNQNNYSESLLSWHVNSEIISIDSKKNHANYYLFVLCSNGDLIIDYLDIENKKRTSNVIFSYENIFFFGAVLCLNIVNNKVSLLSYFGDKKFIISINSVDIEFSGYDSINIQEVNYKVPSDTPLINYKIRDLEIADLYITSENGNSVLGKFKNKLGNIILQWLDIEYQLDGSPVLIIIWEIALLNDTVPISPCLDHEEVIIPYKGYLKFFNRCGEVRSMSLQFLINDEYITSIVNIKDSLSQFISNSKKSKKSDLEMVDLENSRELPMDDSDTSDSDNDSDNESAHTGANRYESTTTGGGTVEMLQEKLNTLSKCNLNDLSWLVEMFIISTNQGRFFKLHLDNVFNLNFEELTFSSHSIGTQDCFLPQINDMALVKICASNSINKMFECQVIALNESFGMQMITLCSVRSLDLQPLGIRYYNNSLDRLLNVNKVLFPNGESETTYSDIISVHEDSDHSSIGDMLPTKSTINMVYLSRHVRTIQYALQFDNENDPNACDDFSGTQIYVSECGSSLSTEKSVLVLITSKLLQTSSLSLLITYNSNSKLKANISPVRSDFPNRIGIVENEYTLSFSSMSPSHSIQFTQSRLIVLNNSTYKQASFNFLSKTFDGQVLYSIFNIPSLVAIESAIAHSDEFNKKSTICIASFTSILVLSLSSTCMHDEFDMTKIYFMETDSDISAINTCTFHSSSPWPSLAVVYSLWDETNTLSFTVLNYDSNYTSKPENFKIEKNDNFSCIIRYIFISPHHTNDEQGVKFKCIYSDGLSVNICTISISSISTKNYLVFTKKFKLSDIRNIRHENQIFDSFYIIEGYSCDSILYYKSVDDDWILESIERFQGQNIRKAVSFNSLLPFSFDSLEDTGDILYGKLFLSINFRKIQEFARSSFLIYSLGKFSSKVIRFCRVDGLLIDATISHEYNELNQITQSSLMTFLQGENGICSVSGYDCSSLFPLFTDNFSYLKPGIATENYKFSSSDFSNIPANTILCIFPNFTPPIPIHWKLKHTFCFWTVDRPYYDIKSPGSIECVSRLSVVSRVIKDKVNSECNTSHEELVTLSELSIHEIIQNYQYDYDHFTNYKGLVIHPKRPSKFSPPILCCVSSHSLNIISWEEDIITSHSDHSLKTNLKCIQKISFNEESQPIAIEGFEIFDSLTSSSSSVNYLIVISRFLKGIEIYFLSLHGTNIIEGSQLKKIMTMDYKDTIVTDICSYPNLNGSFQFTVYFIDRYASQLIICENIKVQDIISAQIPDGLDSITYCKYNLFVPCHILSYITKVKNITVKKSKENIKLSLILTFLNKSASYVHAILE